MEEVGDGEGVTSAHNVILVLRMKQVQGFLPARACRVQKF